MEVEERRSIDEIFESVKGYDVVFTSEVAMADALNERLVEPVLGRFATTPLRYTMSRFQNEDLLREKGLFIEVANSTDLSWRQSSFLLENVLDCWRHDGSLGSVLNYERFDRGSVEQVMEVVRSVDNVFTRAGEVEVDPAMDVAVVGYSDFDEIDKQVLPESFDTFELLKDGKIELPDLKLYGSATEIVRSVVQAVEERSAVDVAVVARRGSIFSTLVRSMLESRGIAINRRRDLREHRDLRALIRVLRLAVNSERRRVEECRSVLNWLGVQIPVEKNREFVSDITSEDSRKLEESLEHICESTLRDAINHLDSHMDADLESDLEQLGVLDSEVSEQLIARLEYFLDTYNVGRESARNGVLLADPTSSEVVDRPIVFHLGIGSGWTPNIPDRPWIDREEEDVRNLKRFKYLIQNGEQQHYLVQERSMGEDVAPSLYINELVDSEIESFRDVSNQRHQTGDIPGPDGFETESYEVEPRQIELISQSSLKSLVRSPRAYLFGDLVGGEDRDYFRRGNLYHDYAEFYANHPMLVESRGRERFVEMMLQEMRSIVDDLRLDILETEFRIGMENIEEFIDSETGEKPGIDAFRHKYADNTFAQKLNVEITSDSTEAWFEDPEFGVEGSMDLVASRKHVVDYKSSSRKSPSEVVSRSNVDLFGDSPDFQSILYLAELRRATADQRLDFTFLHFLENQGRRVIGRGNIQETTAQVAYHPFEFEDFVSTRKMYNLLTDGIGDDHDRRKTLEGLGYSLYTEFFDDRDIPHQYDKDAVEKSQLAEKFIRLAKTHVGDCKRVEKGCRSALRKMVDIRKKNYFREDLDAFEEFVQSQLDLLNDYRRKGFPLENPETEDVSRDDHNNNDMIPL